MNVSVEYAAPVSHPAAHLNPKRPGHRRAAELAAALIILALVSTVFWFVHRYAVNMIYYDQWTDIRVIMHVRSGTSVFGSIWAQHNENRILFPNLIVLALAYTTHFNIILEDYLSGVFWCLTALLLIAAHKRRSPSISWLWYCPVAIVLLSLIPVGDALYGAQIGWFLVLLGLAGALNLLDRPVLTPLALAGAIAFAVVGSYSAIEGLFIWPAGLVLLYLRRRPLAHVVAWFVSGLVTGMVYFIDFDFAAAGGNRSYVVGHPLVAIRFFVSSVGNVIGTFYPNSSPNTGNTGVLVLGALVLVIAVGALISGFRRDQPGGGPVGASLICFGLIFIAFTTLGRSQLGLADAERYSIFTLMIWVGSYLVLIDPVSEWSKASFTWLALRVDRLLGVRSKTVDENEGPIASRSRPWARVGSTSALIGLLALMFIQVAAGDRPAVQSADGWHGAELSAADVTVNLKESPDSLVLSQLGAYDPTFVRQMANYAKVRHLSLFDTPLATQDAEQGLFPWLLTQILRPTSGSRLSGKALLDASAITIPGLQTVGFQITGKGLHDTPVGKAHLTLVGWIALWDTTNVANGIYRLQSVLYLPGGRVAASSRNIWVTVHNNA
jgi:hypothetical protein